MCEDNSPAVDATLRTVYTALTSASETMLFDQHTSTCNLQLQLASCLVSGDLVRGVSSHIAQRLGEIMPFVVTHPDVSLVTAGNHTPTVKPQAVLSRGMQPAMAGSFMVVNLFTQLLATRSWDLTHAESICIIAARPLIDKAQLTMLLLLIARADRKFVSATCSSAPRRSTFSACHGMSNIAVV